MPGDKSAKSAKSGKSSSKGKEKSEKDKKSKGGKSEKTNKKSSKSGKSSRSATPTREKSKDKTKQKEGNVPAADGGTPSNIDAMSNVAKSIMGDVENLGATQPILNTATGAPG